MQTRGAVRFSGFAVFTIFLMVTCWMVLGAIRPSQSQAVARADPCVVEPLTTITGVLYPKGMAVDEDRNLVFVASYSTNSLLVVDGATQSLIRTIPNISSPNQVAYNPTSRRIYVTNRNENRLTVVDGQSYAILASIPVAAGPYGVTVNPATDHVYVAAFTANQLDAIWNGAVQRSFGLPKHPTFVAVDSHNGHVYVASNEAGVIHRIENDETLSLWVSTGDTGIVGMALDAANERIYISSVSNRVYVYDLASRARLAVVNLPGTPKAMTVNPRDQQIFAAPWGSAHSTYQIDGFTNTYRGAAAVGAGDGDGIAINTLTGHLYVANAFDNTLSVLRDSCSPPPPQRYTVGNVEVKALNFTPEGSQIRATGQIRLGDFVTVEDDGSAAWVLFDQQQLTGRGRVVLTAAGQRVDLLRGDFSVSGATGQLTGAAGATILLSQVGGFAITGAPHFDAIDLVAGTVRGQATLNLGKADFAASGILDFLLTATGTGVQPSGNVTFNQAISYGDGSVLSLPATTASLQGNSQIVWDTTLHLNLPENSRSVSLPVMITPAGIQAIVPNVNLALGGGNLALSGITLGNSGLTAAGATLTLPAALGGGTATMENVRIGAGGLSFTRIVVAPSPKPTLGVGGFNLNLQTISLEKAAGGRVYEFVITGQVALDTSGVDGSAVVSLSVDASGQFRGTVSDMAFESAGIGIRAAGVTVEGNTLRAQSATVILPQGLGGASLTVGNLALSPTGLSLGGGRFALPDVDVGGFRLTGLKGGFLPVENGYVIEAAGGFSLPNLGGKGCSGLAVSVKFRIVEGNVLALEIEPAAAPILASPVGIDAPTSVVFESFGLSLRCTIPIGNTGLEIVAVRGSVTVAQGSEVTISVGMTIESSLKVPKTFFAADADVTLRAQPFLFTFDGVVRLFGEEVGGANASIQPDRLKAMLWIDYKIFEGRVAINAWSDAAGFHFTGEGYVGVKLTKGNIVDLGWLKVPPGSMSVGGVKLGVGEFTNRQWGFRGEVCVWKYCTGVYVDTDGNVHFGNVTQYTLKTPPDLAQARSLWLAHRRGERSAADLPDDVILLANGDLVITATVTARTDVMFILSRQAEDAPTLTLVEPGNVPIGPDTVRADVSYIVHTEAGETFPYQEIYTVDDAKPGVWNAILHDAPEDGYGLALLGLTPSPTLANLHAAQDGDRGAQVNWQLTAAQPVTVSIYANPGSITQTLVMTDGAPITVVVESFSGTRIFTQTNAVINGSAQSRQLDLSRLPGGIYHLWLDADDGVNPPVRRYAPEPVTITQPWPSSWQAQLQTQPGFQQIGVRWQPHPSPDVQGYILAVSSPPFTATRTITVGTTTEGILTGLDANVNYRLWVEGVVFDANGAVIRRSQSEQITAATATFPFTLELDSPSGIIEVGRTVTFSLQLQSSAADFPEPVSFFSAQELRTGIGLNLPSAITPTQSGVGVQLGLVVAPSADAGSAQIVLLASGGGVTRTVTIPFVVARLDVALQADPAQVVVYRGHMVETEIFITSAVDLSTGVVLMVQNTPLGVLVHLDKTTILPGEQARLQIHATDLAAAGSYEVDLIAQSMVDRWERPLRVHILEGGRLFLPMVAR